jgi:hypothetical protein
MWALSGRITRQLRSTTFLVSVSLLLASPSFAQQKVPVYIESPSGVDPFGLVPVFEAELRKLASIELVGAPQLAQFVISIASSAYPGVSAGSGGSAGAGGFPDVLVFGDSVAAVEVTVMNRLTHTRGLL